MKIPSHIFLIQPSLRGLAVALAAFGLSGYVASATPFASCVTNSGNNYTFYLNESGGNVTITYEDGSTNSSFNGVKTGTNLAAGPYTFSLAGHTSYEIIVNKIGSGKPSIITTISRGTARGIAANVNGASPYFGYVYSVIGGAGTVMMQSDGSGGGANSPFLGTVLLPPIAGGVPWGTAASSEYRIAVAPDDYVIVSDNASASEGGLVRVNPTFTSAQLLLAGLNPIGSPANHGSAESAGILTAAVGGNPTLYVVDGTYTPNYNQIMVYNLGTAAYANGFLPWTNAPDTIGADVQLTSLMGDGADFGFYAGMSLGTGLSNGVPYTNIYVAVERQSSAPNLQVYDWTATNQLWNSWYNGGPPNDYMQTGTAAAPETGSLPSDLRLSPDGTTLAIIHIDNHITLIGLTNGIPDISTLQVITGLVGTAGNGRGIGWDAAGNIWFTSSGLGNVYLMALGKGATAVTTGNASHPTSFALLTPATVSVTAANNSVVGPIASQSNPYGNPTSNTFTLTRSGGTTHQPLTVNFTLAGTAASTNYTTTAASTITFAPNQLTTNVTITAVNDSVARPTLAVTLTVQSSPVVNVGTPGSATIYIVNTAPNAVVTSVVGPTMYKALSNDFAAFALVRWGDTNAPSFTVSSYTYAGTALVGTDYTPAAVTSVTFNPGDISYTNQIFPLVGGHPPVHGQDVVYVGNKTAIIGVGPGSGYTPGTVNATLTILDDANPPAPVLFYDPLTNALAGGNPPHGDGTSDGYAQWHTTYANDNMDANPGPDYDVEFGYDLTSGTSPFGSTGVIPLPPNGSRYALRVTCNKALGQAAGVNVYPTNISFSGNFAIRFNLNFVQEGNLNFQTEGLLFGMNHGGAFTNWLSGSGVTPPTQTPYPWAADGIWVWLNGGAGSWGPGDYQFFTGITPLASDTGWIYLKQDFAPSFINYFKPPAYTGIPDLTGDYGVPVNESAVISGDPATVSTWSDVELKQVGSNVTFSINKTPILTYVNTNSIWDHGTLMLGYNDAFDSLGDPDGAAYISNLRVVRLGAPNITGIVPSGANEVINFTIVDGSYTTLNVQSAGVVTGPYSNAAATITSLGAGAFQAVVPQNGNAQFYRIVTN